MGRSFKTLAIYKQMYPATYNFRDDDVGDNPTGWTFDLVGGTVNVIASLNDHKKVVELHNDTGDVYMKHTFSSVQTDETYECWIAVNNIGAVSSYNDRRRSNENNTTSV